MDEPSLWASADFATLLESGLEGWTDGLGQTRIGAPVAPRTRQIKPLTLPKSPTHRKRHQALAWLLIPLLATRWDFASLPLATASEQLGAVFTSAS